MKNMFLILIALLTMSFMIIGCAQSVGQEPVMKGTSTPDTANIDGGASASMEKDNPTTAMTTDDASIDSVNTDVMMEKTDEKTRDSATTDASMSAYAGKILAGTTSLYLEFDQKDYERALADNKLIVLFFYAEWCPSCRGEQPEIEAAFDSLNSSDVIGFRVNYKDSYTDDAENALAQQYQIPYQHTKVFVKDGASVLKAPDGWDKERYLTEIAKYNN